MHRLDLTLASKRHTTFTVALLSGSLRTGSANSAALRAVEKRLSDHRERQVVTRWCRIDSVPPFNEDVEAAGWPPPVENLRAVVRSADLVVISTPEYNGSIPGALKNALDWLSRPSEAGVLTGKVVATMSASPASFGAVWAQENLRFVLERCGALLANQDLIAIPHALDAVDDSGEIVFAGAIEKINDLVETVSTHFGFTDLQTVRRA